MIAATRGFGGGVAKEDRRLRRSRAPTRPRPVPRKHVPAPDARRLRLDVEVGP